MGRLDCAVAAAANAMARTEGRKNRIQELYLLYWARIMSWHRSFLLLAVGGSIAAGAANPGIDLIQAVKRQDMAAVDSLLARKSDLAATEADGSTALHWAAQRNDAKLVDRLLAAGAKVDAATRYNIPPLYFACLNGNLAMVESLLKAGADPNSTAEQGQTALDDSLAFRQCGRGQASFIAGREGGHGEPYRGQTALMWAASEGNRPPGKR